MNQVQIQLVQRSLRSDSTHPFLRFAKGLEFVDVFFLVNAVVGQDQSLSDGAQGIFDSVEVATTVRISPRSADDLRSELVCKLLNGLGYRAGLLERLVGLHQKRAAADGLCQQQSGVIAGAGRMLSAVKLVTLIVSWILGMPAAAAELPGQAGPTAALLQPGGLRLTTRRTEDLFPDGNSIWRVELHRGDQRLASWRAASGIARQQRADRRWSPGNAAPLPAGPYWLATPEPWGQDLWFDLQPRFDTTRSALGIHHCYPGTGCICIPDRGDINALAAWVRQAEIRELSVVN